MYTLIVILIWSNAPLSFLVPGFKSKELCREAMQVIGEERGKQVSAWAGPTIVSACVKTEER